MTIRQIHDFGPAVGKYVPGIATDIRDSLDAARVRLRASGFPSLSELHTRLAGIPEVSGKDSNG
jgi:ABC-type amino acid transport substrate-binding protein